MEREQDKRPKKSQQQEITTDGMEVRSENIGDAGRQDFILRAERYKTSDSPMPRGATDSVHDAISRHKKQARRFAETTRDMESPPNQQPSAQPQTQEDSLDGSDLDTQLSHEHASRSVPERPGKLRFGSDPSEPNDKAPRRQPASPDAAKYTPSGMRLEKTRLKAERSGQKLEKTRKNLPKKRSIRVERAFDEKKGKAKRKFRFEEEVKSQHEHIKGPLPTRPVKAGANAAVRYGHSKIYQVEHENVGTQAAHKAELFAEGGLRGAYRHHKTAPYRKVQKLERRTTKLNIKASYQQALHDNPKLKSNTLYRMLQKQKIKRQYAKAAREAKKVGKTAKKTGSVIEKAAKAVMGVVKRHPLLFTIIALALFVVFFFSSLFSSCSNMVIGSGTTILASCYMADDSDIDSAELIYTEWETDLQIRLNNVEHDHPGFDEYRFSVDDIGHDPYELMAYLTAVYHDFKYEDIKPILRQIFDEQYTLEFTETTETRTETRTIMAGESIGTVVTSGYCNCVICCGSWAGGPTASGVMPTANHTIAVDASNPTLPMGTRIIMGGIEYKVEDTGNFHRYGVDFDIYFNDHATATNWGHRRMEAYLAGGNNPVEVTTTYEARILNIDLTTQSFANLIAARMNSEQWEIANLLMRTYGNRQYAFNVFNFNWLPYVSSYYGYRLHPISGNKDFHKGVDITVATGTKILSGQDGVVTFAGNSGDYGLTVVIENEKAGSPGGSLVTKYAHCSELLVSAGQAVSKGDVIAKVGSTGNTGVPDESQIRWGGSSGAHLHLEVIVNGQYLNPIYFAVTGDDGSGRIPPGSPGGKPFPEYPGEPMDDARFAAMMAEAQKHLGKPYVFGASGPNSFDCSGFVCYVLNHSGVKNVGRTNAQGLYNICTPVSRANAQPGDLIFFTGTYSAGHPVTHIGIYIGNGQMIHAGKPIQYSGIDTPYWTSHFYSFGRIPD